MAQITCLYGCRQLQKHSKVKMGSQERIMTTGMGIVHGILSQPQHFLPSWLPLLAKNEQLHGWFGPNDMCKWLQIAAEAFQSQNRFMSKVYKVWDGNCTWFLHSNTPFSTKPTPKIWPKTDNLMATLAQITCVHDCRLLQKHSKVNIGSQARIIMPGMGIIHGILSQPQHFLPS